MDKEKHTKLIVGLGNPGKKYEHNLHNLGFIAIDLLVNSLNLKMKKAECRAVTAETYVKGCRIIIAKPQTYMNLSGESVRELIGRYKVSMENLLVIYDDIDIGRATLRIRKEGSAGTHNGMKNIIWCLDDDSFPRIRIGAGKPPAEIPLADYVLMDIPESWQNDYFTCLTRAADAAKMFMDGADMDAVMREYNK